MCVCVYARVYKTEEVWVDLGEAIQTSPSLIFLEDALPQEQPNRHLIPTIVPLMTHDRPPTLYEKKTCEQQI